MLLTLTLTCPAPELGSPDYPASDLGYLLYKHPDRVHQASLPFGQARVFFPEVSDERATAALLLDVDPVALSRQVKAEQSAPLEPYVNDRPYASGHFLAAALLDTFSTAMSGRSKERQALADLPLPLSVEIPCLAARGPADLVERLFAPLGYQIVATPIALDPLYPEWGERPYLSLKLSATLKLSEVLAHLYILLPVLDGSRKPYFLDETEVDKLLRRGAGWLGTHPERELIVRRYLQLRSLIEQAGERLGIPAAPPRSQVHEERLERVAELLRKSSAARVLDLGCGEGKLLGRLLPNAQFRQLTGLDVSARSLEFARRQLKLDERPELEQRLTLLHGSLTYRDARLHGYDAAALVEVIEHLDPSRLDTLSANVFGDAQPRTVIVTTPNREYNAIFAHADSLHPNLRHADHRFEWTRAEFEAWARAASAQYGYAVRFEGVGEEHPDFGALTQVGVFERLTPQISRPSKDEPAHV
ncbi:3' terminal RNA ribose 2'-O-methyltransferase Hen1 (plasmid) [Deinococcus psychrotolerans]|uniref:Small RNA 2'-O-methyltransferase n=1 Tax=Deinococcus psychrotolerans TaxID=2489213 RepID=A0A3G8YK08_9DEIO|nr:3' terminal RNA ribose 2'-O-methyltransferase Hen1 [Deinococcus psychrotolerans]AZI44637.1 3' terminal RNA ribose 2'-O-methyltransferase Hen1 [Deinococcus psychrotolerans]